MAKWNIRNLNPRFGISWDIFGDGKTSLRGGIGTYSTNTVGDALNTIAFSQKLAIHTIMYPNYPDPFAPNPFFNPIPGSVTTAKYDAKKGLIAPYSLQTSLGIEREIFKDFSLGANLAWTKGYCLPFFVQNNPVIPGTSVTRIDPTMGDWYTLSDNVGKSDYKGFYLTLKKRFSKGWGIEIAYTLSKSMSNVEYVTTTPVNYADPQNSRMWGPMDMDARHVLCVNGLADLPLGFQASVLFYYNSPTPWTAIYNTDVNKDGLTSDYVDQYRNSRRGFNQYFLNFRISKSVNISRVNIQLLVEGHNITNKTNFMSVYSRYGQSLFGMPTGAGDPREFQVGIRVNY